MSAGRVLYVLSQFPSYDEAFLLREGTGEYHAEGEAIRFGPGRAEHAWTELRGALPKLDGLSVYLTGFTPFRTTLRIG